MEDGLPDMLYKPSSARAMQAQSQRNTSYSDQKTCSAEMTSPWPNMLQHLHHDSQYSSLPTESQHTLSCDPSLLRSTTYLPTDVSPFGAHSFPAFEQSQFHELNSLDGRSHFDTSGMFTTPSPFDNEGYISTPSLVESPPASRPRTCPDDIGSYHSLHTEPTMFYDNAHPPSAYCLSSSTPPTPHQYSTPTYDQTPLSRQRIGVPTSYFSNPLLDISSPGGSHTTGRSNRFPREVKQEYTSNRVLEPFEDEDTADAESQDDGITGEPYAQLIYKALMSTAPQYGMVLKDIYAWFARETDKARNSDSKGWQNSIRHNLSMNHAFQAERPTPKDGEQPKKNCNIWRLTPTAIESGVESTTRYRKAVNGKKTGKSAIPAPQRQRSGAKGGRAAKKAARARRAEQCENGISGRKQGPIRDRRTRLEHHVRSRAAESASDQPANTPCTDPPPFDWSRVSGVTDPTPDMDLFYDQPSTPLMTPFEREPVVQSDPVMEDLMAMQYSSEPNLMFPQTEFFNQN